MVRLTNSGIVNQDGWITVTVSDLLGCARDSFEVRHVAAVVVDFRYCLLKISTARFLHPIVSNKY